jgi:hypothetical protein
LRVVAGAGACAVGVRRRMVWLCAVSVFVGFLVFAGVAQAGKVHPFVSSFPAGTGPQAVAVDQATGDVLVVDVAAGAVLKFDSAGAPSNFSALSSDVLDGAGGADATPGGGFAFDPGNSANQVAVDNSGGPADGYVYVTSAFAGVIDVFDATGTFVGEIDGSLATPQSGGETCGVATDPSGHVYSASFDGHVDKYTPTDADPAHDSFDGQLEGLSQPCNVAADSLGDVYASTWDRGPLTKYDASQINQPAASGTQVDPTSFAVAVDPSNNDVYVDEGTRVAQFDTSGASIGQSGLGSLNANSFGVAIHGTTGDLYVSDAGSAVVDHFGAAVDIAGPDVTIDPPSNVTTSHATFSGTVNPNGTDPLNDTTWHFEYSTDGGNTWTSTTGGDAGTGTSPVQVSDDVNNLLPHQSVKVRLVAVNAGATATSSEQDFDTPTLTPDVITDPAQDITPDHASLTARLNAHNAPTTYFFEYGTDTGYGTHVPDGNGADGGSSVFGTAVQQNISGLQPGTTYHYRIVAHNAAGTVPGQDQSFTTTTAPARGPPRADIPGSGFLPDDRGWELVSPPDKHGSGVDVDSARVRPAAGETPDQPMAATFASLGTFADVHGTGVGNDYMAIRTGQTGTPGWATHAITPPEQPLTFPAVLAGSDSLWQDELSPDLNTGVVLSWTPLTDAPDVKDVDNLYRRTDLRTPGNSTYDLLTACTLCAGTPLPPISDVDQLPRVAGASADFSHVTFESDQRLVAGSTGGFHQPNLYEWVNGTIRLAAVLPDNACATPPCIAPSSTAGQDAGAGNFALRHSPHTISADGSRIIFTDLSAGDGQSTGNLYVRINGTSTVQINATERTDCADHDPCTGTPEPDPAGPQPAEFQTASTDGSRVFFITSEQLTDTPLDNAAGLYMYDANAPAGHHLTVISVDHEPADALGSVHGVMGASDDGHYVYFISGGQLVAGQPPSPPNFGVYEWHDGSTFYIGALANLNQTNDTTFDLLPNLWGLAPLHARVTPDGRHVLFQSSTGAGLTGYNSNKHVELYLYSADSHELQCVSCRPDGSPAQGDATDMSRTFTGGTNTSSHVNHPLSDDGSKVFFSTTDALVSRDTNGKSDVYEFDSASGTVRLLSSGTDSGDSFFMDASANGDDAFIATQQALSKWDVDQSYDLYDARVGGGLPDPNSSIPCSDDACQGAPSGGSVFAPPGSETLHGGGNVRSSVRRAKPKPRRVRCRRGFVRKRVRGKVRCVRAPKKHRHKPKARRAGRVERAALARKGR